MNFQCWLESYHPHATSLQDAIINKLHLDPQHGLSLNLIDMDADELKDNLNNLRLFTILPDDVKNHAFMTIDKGQGTIGDLIRQIQSPIQTEAIANFGFDKEIIRKDMKGLDENPTKELRITEVIDEVKRLGSVGTYKPRQTMQGDVRWGESFGSLKLTISPSGQMKAILRKSINDLLGEQVWICKHIWPLSGNRYKEHDEVPLAHAIFEQAEQIVQQFPEAPQPEYDLEKLTMPLANAVLKEHPQWMIYKGILKKHENYHKIIFEFRGGGVERVNSGNRVEQFDIDLFFDTKTGMIRCWGYDIESSLNQHTWKPKPSEWDENFSPVQPVKEIMEIIVSAFVSY